MSPFDKTRYERLLEGLEITILPYRDAVKADAAGRIDSSFFEKRFIEVRRLAAGWDRLDAHAKTIVCGPFGSNLLNENYVDCGIPMIRPFNLRSGRADAGEVALLEESFVKASGLKAFPRGTVMFARVGDIGAGVSLYENSTISPNIIAADLKNSIDPFFVGVFANTRFGLAQLEAGMKVVAQPTISTEAIRALRIPPLSKPFQEKIAKTFNEAISAQDQGNNELCNAEIHLLHALGLENWQPSEPLTYISNSRDAFASGRFDAEYFHPAKIEALEMLDRLSDCTVGELFDSIRELWQPANGPAIEPVRNYDLTDALSPFLDGAKAPVERAAIASTKKKIRADDLVVSRLRSYLKEISLVQSGGKTPMVASTEFIVLRPKPTTTLAVEALLIYLRSPLPQLVFKWSQDGSNHPRFDEKELLRLPVPRVLIEQADEYVDGVRGMIVERERSTQLLDAAKRTVEIAIEDSEAAALAYLEGISG